MKQFALFSYKELNVHLQSYESSRKCGYHIQMLIRTGKASLNAYDNFMKSCLIEDVNGI